MELTTHEVLVQARNGAAQEGAYNVNWFGIWDSDSCGTPRCMLGWCAWESGIRLPKLASAQCLRDLTPDLPAVYGEALQALWATRPRDPVHVRYMNPGAGRVEDVALAIADEYDGQPAKQREVVLDWFDSAIAATAPTPDLSFLRDEVSV